MSIALVSFYFWVNLGLLHFYINVGNLMHNQLHPFSLCIILGSFIIYLFSLVCNSEFYELSLKVQKKNAKNKTTQTSLGLCTHTHSSARLIVRKLFQNCKKISCINFVLFPPTCLKDCHLMQQFTVTDSLLQALYLNVINVRTVL